MPKIKISRSKNLRAQNRLQNTLKKKNKKCVTETFYFTFTVLFMRILYFRSTIYCCYIGKLENSYNITNACISYDMPSDEALKFNYI